MADDRRSLARMIEQFGRLREADQQRVLDQLSPAERVALRRLSEPQRDPQTLLSKPMAEWIERLRDGETLGMTEAGRSALLDAAAEADSRAQTGAQPGDSARPSLIDRVGRSLGSLVA